MTEAQVRIEIFYSLTILKPNREVHWNPSSFSFCTFSVFYLFIFGFCSLFTRCTRLWSACLRRCIVVMISCQSRAVKALAFLSETTITGPSLTMGVAKVQWRPMLNRHKVVWGSLFSPRVSCISFTFSFSFSWSIGKQVFMYARDHTEVVKTRKIKLTIF